VWWQEIGEMSMCVNCKYTGMTYVGNGHRAAGYPFAELGTAVSCSCDLGKALDAGQRIPMPPATEVTAETIAKVSARKAAFNIRADAYAAKVKREMDELRAKPGYMEPLWFIDQQRQQGETQ